MKSVRLPYLTVYPLKWIEKFDPWIFYEATHRISLLSKPASLIFAMNLSLVTSSSEEYYLKESYLVSWILGSGSFYIAQRILLYYVIQKNTVYRIVGPADF